MSLYQEVADSLSKKGLTGSIRSVAGSALGSVAAQAANALGGGRLANAVARIGGGMANAAVMRLVDKHIPLKVQRSLNAGAGMAGDLMNGNVDGAGMRLLDSGLLSKWLPGMGGIASQVNYWGTPTPLFGGITPTEALDLFEEIKGQTLAKKNLWLIEVSSPLHGDASQRFNLFATELDYAPLTITGTKHKIGSAAVDSVQSSEPIELRLTTMDDMSGSIKRWFDAHCAAAAPADGTVGVPASYAVRIKIVHAFITQGSNRGGYQSVGLFRPANLEVSLSRREDGMQDVQMTFAQLDTFMAA